ncbi:MAG: hypothetical protein M3O70_23200 [Actinomycetota bacterium]|nr:hypothetical protein [Actinomycetota bacterium]
MSGRAPFDLRDSKIAAVGMDLQRSRAEVVLKDGRRLVAPITASLPLKHPDRLAQVWLRDDLTVMHGVTIEGDIFTSELPVMAPGDPLRGRTVVYLDQKDWRTLRDFRMGDLATLAEAEVEAAQRLIAGVEANEVVLPFSSGHLMETAAWGDQRRRYEVALTMAQLTRGWQLRDPLDVRIREIRSALTHRSARAVHDAGDVITLSPNAAHVARFEPYRAPIDWSPEQALASEALVSLAAYYSVILDVEPTPRGQVQGWADRQQQFTDWLATQELTKKLRDSAIDGFFLDDTITEIARAAHGVGISLSQLRSWMELGAPRDIPRMPSLSLFREVLRERHKNPTSTWRTNDLTDMAYLTCAAAYAGHVVAERHFTHHLQKAVERTGTQVGVHRSISALMPALGWS